MKRGLVAALLAGLLVIGIASFVPGPNPVQAAEAAASERTITVTGRGQLDVKPDTAVVSLGVTELRSTPMEAYSALNASITKIADALKGMGIKEDQIQTSVFNLSAEYDWTQDRGRQLVGYRATNTLTVTTQELDKVANLIQAAVEAGANDLNGVSFSVKDSDKLLEEALKLAVGDARAKANLVAGELGARVARVKSVSIQDQGTSLVKARAEMALDGMAAAAPVPVFDGTSTFSATVSVTFELE